MLRGVQLLGPELNLDGVGEEHGLAGGRPLPNHGGFASVTGGDVALEGGGRDSKGQRKDLTS